MNSLSAEAPLDSLSLHLPLDMEMSGFEPPEAHFFQPLEAGTPLNRTASDTQIDFSFLDITADEDTPDCLLQQVPVFLDRMVWSSLTVVLLLHATFAFLLPLLIKEPVEVTPTVIEAQLVLLPGGSEQDGPKGAKNASPAPAAAVPPPPAPPVKEKPVKPHQTAKIDGILPPEQKNHPKARKRPQKIVRVVHHYEEPKEVTRAHPVSTIDSHATLSPGSAPSAAAGAPGTGKATGPPGRGGSGNVKGPGGSGPSEIAFGSANGPRFLHQVAPAYPALARRLERQGTVLLRVTIGMNGRAVKVEVLKKAGFGMDEEALKAVEESTFVPAKRGGQPVTCRALLPIRFVIEQS